MEHSRQFSLEEQTSVDHARGAKQNQEQVQANVELVEEQASKRYVKDHS